MEEHFTAQMFVDYVVRARGLSPESVRVPPVVVGLWSPRMLALLRKALGEPAAQPWLYGEALPFYPADVEGRPVGLVRMRVGAPAAVILLEELAACGARTFIGAGYAGSLQPGVPAGSLFIPTACLSEEGTSAHYAAPETAAGWLGRDAPGPAPRLAGLLQQACEAEGVRPATGIIWTTDAPYRELRSKVERYRAQGVVGVDMETSAVYTLARFRGLEACHLLMVSDELWHDWRPAFAAPEVLRAEEQAVAVLLRLLRHDLRPAAPWSA